MTNLKWPASSATLACTLLATLICGCGSGVLVPPPPSIVPVPPAAPKPAKYVYVVQNNVLNAVSMGAPDLTASDTVLQYSAGADGDVTPATVASGPVGYLVTAIAFDPAGQLYLAGVNGQSAPVYTTSIFAYSNSLSPTRTIQLPVNGTVFGMTTDSAGNLYVAAGTNPDYGSVYVFAATADGNTPPIRTIVCDKAGIVLPGSVAVDSSGELYVADWNNPVPAISVFAAEASGSATPVRTLHGASIGFKGIVPIALDSAGDLYVSGQDPTAGYGIISVFSPTANGDATPVRSIGGPLLGAFSGVGGVQVDATGVIYAVSFAGPANLQSPSIVSFPASASGNVAPASRATSTAYTSSLAGPLALQ